MSAPAGGPKIRASALGGLFDCAQRYYLETLQGHWRPGSARSLAGTATHAGAASFDSDRAAGAAGDLWKAVEIAAQAVKHPGEEIDFEGEPVAKVVDRAVLMTRAYCAEVGATRVYEAIEITCPPLTIETPRGALTLTGTPDRVRRWADGHLGVSDLKTGARSVAGACDESNGVRRAITAGHGPQLGIYALLAGAALGEPVLAPAEIVGIQNCAKPYAACGLVNDPVTPLLGTPERPGLIELAAGILHSGVFPPNPKSVLCSPKYCGGWGCCPYHD